jgi:hypothetical protein
MIVVRLYNQNLRLKCIIHLLNMTDVFLGYRSALYVGSKQY